VQSKSVSKQSHDVHSTPIQTQSMTDAHPALQHPDTHRTDTDEHLPIYLHAATS